MTDQIFTDTPTTTPATKGDLESRLQLIESMLLEGRRTTERWGWVFVLWGVAYYVAILWATLGNTPNAWPITMLAAGSLNGVIAWRKTSSRPNTKLGRAIGSIWVSLGISMMILFLSLGIGHHTDQNALIATAAAMLGMANSASALALRWTLQFITAVTWWATAVIAAFAHGNIPAYAFLVALFFCQIVFGIINMIADYKQNHQVNSHA